MQCLYVYGEVGDKRYINNGSKPAYVDYSLDNAFYAFSSKNRVIALLCPECGLFKLKILQGVETVRKKGN